MLSRRAVLRTGAVGVAGVAAAGLGLGTVASLDALRDDDTARGRTGTAPDAPTDGRPAPGSGALTEGTTPPPDLPPIDPGPVVRGTFRSRARGGVPTAWSLIRPPDVDGPLPLVVALHGLGGSTAALLSAPWDLPRALARAVDDGVPPFALGTVSGGTTFWHERPWGEDAGAMVVDELLPRLLTRPDVVTAPIGMLGWSMGGYGVLRLAGRLGPAKVAAVVASSPGLYTDPDQAHPDGFVDAAEYRRFSVMDDQAALADIPVRIDIGTSDPFYGATRAYVRGFPADADLVAEFGEGGHELVFTQGVLPDQLRFLGERVTG